MNKQEKNNYEDEFNINSDHNMEIGKSPNKRKI